MARSRHDLPPAVAGSPAPSLVRQVVTDDGAIGEVLVDEVRRSARRVARSYRASKYSVAGNWTDGLDDLVGDVLADVFVRDGQLDFLVDNATSIDEFRRMLDWHTRRVLARHRRTTVIDNLLRRARKILAGGEWASEARSGQTAYRRAGALVAPRAATAGEIYAAARAVRLVPVVEPNLRSDRAPIVYHHAQLVEVLERVAAVLPCVFTIRELDRILELALTRFLPTVLDTGVDESVDVDVLDPRAVAASQRVIASLVEPEPAVLLAKLDGLSDTAVAALIGVSRPTAAGHKRAALDAVRAVLTGLDPSMHLAVIDQVGLQLRQPRP